MKRCILTGYKRVSVIACTEMGGADDGGAE